MGQARSRAIAGWHLVPERIQCQTIEGGSIAPAITTGFGPSATESVIQSRASAMRGDRSKQERQPMVRKPSGYRSPA